VSSEDQVFEAVRELRQTLQKRVPSQEELFRLVANIVVADVRLEREAVRACAAVEAALASGL